MGNEESQQGAPAPGQPTFGMGPPPQQPRFGGAPAAMASAARPGAPGISGMRLGGPGPPAALRGGPGIVPGGPGPPAAMRGAVQAQQPVRPVQVGVQPWAEPPVVQPQRFRGPGSVQQQPVRGPVPQQAPRPLAVQQQQLQLQQQQAKQQAMAAEEEVGLDLSNLSEAEKAKILSVMARAQDLDEDYERHKRAKEEATEQRPQLLCPLCQAADLTTETNKMCGDCGKNFCQKCGTFVPGEGRRSVWVCNTCSNRRKQQSAAMASGQQQDTVTYTQAGQKVAGGVDLNQRKDETMSREYLHPTLDDVVSPLPDTGSNEYYLLMDEEDQDWSAEDSSFSDRTSSIRLMLEDDEEDFEEEDSDEGGGVGGSALTYYDRSPGEVYTIPEEEEDMTSPMTSSTWDGHTLNPDTASSLIRWRGMGQPFQQSQQPQQQQMQQPQQSVSLIGTSSGGGGFVSGSLIPSVTPIGRGTIPRTVPLTAVSQQQWPNSQPQQQNQWNLQQQMVQQGGQQQQISLQPHQQNATTGMTTTTQQQQLNQQKQLQAKGGKVEDWSPVTDLSPILDVSPSLEAAEQELMEKCQEADTLRPIPRATSGTISGMLADFNKALGLATTPTMDEQRSLVASTATQPISGTVGSGVTVPTTTLTGNGTEMDQNQNLVQQQFQLQQQQLMIQQQQQVIAQQQQQLQQQVHLQQQMHQQQQIQSQQQQLQSQQQVQDMQLQQQQASLAQTGVAVGGTPMQQQPQSQRKVHRRLPQPTMDQMHAAVAIAAQTPKSKSQTPRSNTPSYQRPVSPLMATSSGLLSVQQSTGHSPSVSPTPRKDQQDNINFDMEGGKKIRRRLPPVPLDQEPVPLRRTKDRTRTLSMPLSTSADRGSWTDGRRIPQRTTSLDDGMSLTVTTTSSELDFLQNLTSSTDTYLQFLSSKDFLGTTTTTTSVLASIPSSIGLSTTSLLGRRDLSAPHSLSSYMRGSVGGMVPSTSASYLLDHSDSKLPSYIMSLKQQLREELRSVTEQSRRRITDPDLSGLLSHWPDTSTYDPLRKLGSSTLPLPSGRLGGTSLGGPALRRSRHRRHASDTKLSTSFPAFGREGYADDPLYRYKFYHPTSSMPFKSFEFESIDDHLRTDGLYGSSPYTRNSSLFPRGGSTYPRRSSLTDMMLRDTPLTSKSMESTGMRKYNRDMARLRRHTDTGLVSLGLGLDPYGRTPGGYRHLRKPRSWHPSPYVSEDEDEREEKKAKIKAEIARRRQHIEENARLHDELYKVARGRDMTGGGYVSPAYGGDRLYTSPISLESGGSSLEEMDMDYLRRYPYTSYGAPHASRRTASSYLGYEGRHPHQPWQYEGGFVEDDPLFDPLYDYSPLAPTTDSETDLAPMPLLPDMPTRSRKLLHDLGSTPLAYSDKHYTTPRSGVAPQPYDEYADGRGAVDDRRAHQPSADRQHSTNHHQRKAQNSSKTSQKYDFPVKRILLTRDPKDRSVSGNGLGMKVVGGKEIPGSNGMIGAYVARIYPGGVVETLGEVREGDQVLEWNGVSLTGKTYEEVQRIIASSGDEVEIVIRSDFNMLSSRPSTQHHHHQGQPQNHRLSRSRDGGGPQQHLPQGSGGGGGRSREQHSGSHGRSSGYNRNYDSAYESADYYQPLAEEGVNNSNHHRGDRVGPSSPTRGYRDTRGQHQQRIVSPVHEKGDNSDNKEKYRAEDISGEIQLQVCHDSKVGILYVTIVRARNLVTSRDNSGLPDPYVICYLLPDRCFENQRRTRYFSRCSNPEWKQTMVYPHIPQDQLKRKHLEISVWNYDINRPPEFLGEVIIDLKDTSVIDEQSRWYKLHPHDPKKYPCQSSSTLNNEGAMKMARLNNPAQKTLYFEGQDDIRKSNNLEKRFFKQLTKKSNVNENYTRASEQSELATSRPPHGQHHRPSPAPAGLPWRRLLHPVTPIILSNLLGTTASPVLTISA